MSWEKSSYTAAGAALLSESLSGGALVITRAVSGTGTADADLSGETGVSGETHDLKLLDIHRKINSNKLARDRRRARQCRCIYKKQHKALSLSVSQNTRPAEIMPWA